MFDVPHPGDVGPPARREVLHQSAGHVVTQCVPEPEVHLEPLCFIDRHSRPPALPSLVFMVSCFHGVGSMCASKAV